MLYRPLTSNSTNLRRMYRVPTKRWIEFGLFGALAIVTALVFLSPALAGLGVAAL